MNEFSKICLQLAYEVLRVCEDAKIPCVLADECVHRILKDSEGFNQLYLIVKTDDFDKLFELLNETVIPNRGVECMKNNDWYPDFSMRYVDTGTACFYENIKYRYASVGVFIVPLRKKMKKHMRLFYDRLEHWELGNGRKIYPKLLKAYKMKSEELGYITGMKWKRSTYVVEELLGGNFVSVENTSFPTSNLNEDRKRFAYKFVQPISYTTEVSAESMETEKVYYNTTNMGLSFYKFAGKKLIKRIWKKLHPVAHDWNKIQCVNDRDLLRLKYEKKKPLILELYKNNDKERLMAELKPYHKILNQHFKLCKITIVFDPQIFEIYKEIYGEIKGEKYIREISKRVPKEWRML